MSKKPYIVRGGKLYVQITREGKRVRFSTGLKDTLPNRKFVESNLDSILANRARASVKSKNSLAHFLDRFLDEAKTLKKSSQISYKSSVKKLNALLSTNRDIASFTRADIEELYAKLNARAVSVSVASRLKMVLNSVFECALNEGLIPKNPMYKKRLSNLTPRKEAQPFSLDEIAQVLSACDELAGQNPKAFWFKCACVVAFFTGLRSGELLALKWENIDFLAGKIYVKHTINRTGLTSPKTSSSLREVELLPIVAKELGAYARANGICGNEGKGFVFRDFADKPFIHTSGEWGELWRAVLASAGLTYRRFYNTRHSFASVMISKGENIMWVSKMLGHKNANITLSTYAKYVESARSVRASFLDSFMPDTPARDSHSPSLCVSGKGVGLC